ncbi:MAG TPA: hypothetical protein VHF89_13350 [Solirubrobacteraceae bacterium]|nr:hypothetical protein [Solirubrobacteraceae bacterium]
MRRGAVAGTAAAAGCLGWVGGVRTLLTDDGEAVLTDARAATYESLVEAVGRSPHNQVDARLAGRARHEFAAEYAERFPDAQAHIDRILDALDRGTDGGSFAQLTPEARLRMLRAWLRSRRKHRIAVAQQAVELAGVSFQPDPLLFHPSPVAI